MLSVSTVIEVRHRPLPWYLLPKGGSPCGDRALPRAAQEGNLMAPAKDTLQQGFHSPAGRVKVLRTEDLGQPQT